MIRKRFAGSFLLLLPEAATRKHTVSMRRHTGKTVSEQEAAQADTRVRKSIRHKCTRQGKTTEMVETEMEAGTN
jgi:hypothetical protein